MENFLFLARTQSWDESLRYSFFLTQQLVLQRSCEEMMANEKFFLPFIVLLRTVSI